ncbi:NADPH-dependent FMN reductase [Streptomyces sp. NPDC058525]|uniref:NADPH-dependent FMN reductase n=1 Tax=Streptomyces sp. NPDC058525 TaxID=3346538 RepID=UPI0036525C2C
MPGDSQAYGAGSIPVIRSCKKAQVSDLGLLRCVSCVGRVVRCLCAGLRAAIGEAAAVLICTPEYAGTLPGSFKNLLDWTVGGTEICDKPVAWVNAAVAGRGQGAEATLRLVLGYTGAAIVESACARIPVAPHMVGADGLVTDPDVREQIGNVLALLAEGSADVSRTR